MRFEGFHEAHGEKLRFLVAGGFNTAVSYAVFAAVLGLTAPMLAPLAASASGPAAWMGAHYYLVAQWGAWLISVPGAALVLKYFAFRSRGHAGVEIMRSYVVYLPTQLFSMGLLWVFVEQVGMSPLLGQLLTAMAAATLSYLGHKHFTFQGEHT